MAAEPNRSRILAPMRGGSGSMNTIRRYWRNHKVALALALVIGMGPWIYLYGLLDANWRATRRGAMGEAYHSDFFVRWLGTRECLQDRADPYSAAVTEQIQRGVYGHVLGAAAVREPQAFVYPAHVMLLVAPLAMLPFVVAERVFSGFLLVMALSLVPLFAWGLDMQWEWEAQCMAIVVLFASFPLVEALYVQQFALVVTFLFAAGIAALHRGRLWLAGGLLACSTIKPQLSWLVLAWLMLWAVTRWRERKNLLISFALSVVLLVSGAECLLPGWIAKWLRAAGAYLHYPEMRTPMAWLLPGRLGWAATLLAMLTAGVLLWFLRSAEAGDERFSLAIALALSASLLVVPTWRSFQYNQVLLVPSALVMAARWKSISRLQRGLATLAGVVVGFSSVGALVVSCVVLVARVSPQRLGEMLMEMPLFNFAVAPVIVFAVLVEIAWDEAGLECGLKLTQAAD
jgi:hypothetical protein